MIFTMVYTFPLKPDIFNRKFEEIRVFVVQTLHNIKLFFQFNDKYGLIPPFIYAETE